jgi:predicted dehydrogenase
MFLQCNVHLVRSQQEYVLQALQSGKHVLLNDPVSTSMGEFIEQQKLAKKYGKFIQFSTMFVHQFQGMLH